MPYLEAQQCPRQVEQEAINLFTSHTIFFSSHFVLLFENLWIDEELLNYRLLVSYKHTPEPLNFTLQLVDHISEVMRK